MISQAGSEGIDLKNIRQVHIMEPWYNMNRIEQIIGRARRNCSHMELPLEKRNVQVFLHATMLPDDVESMDMYLYRLSEKKSINIGKITRLLKAASIDCLLNKEQQSFSKINQQIKLELRITRSTDSTRKHWGDQTKSSGQNGNQSFQINANGGGWDPGSDGTPTFRLMVIDNGTNCTNTSGQDVGCEDSSSWLDYTYKRRTYTYYYDSRP
jgi:hypothetical protein